MKHDSSTRGYRSIFIVLWSVISVVSTACYGGLCVAVQAQHSDARTASQEENKLPKISEVVFLVRQDKDNRASSWVGQAHVVAADDGLKMESVKTLISSVWWDGIGAYSMSPDGKRLLVTRTSPKYAEVEQRDLLLVSLPNGETKTLRGDGADYGTLGWSSDGQLISYVSPIPIPYPLAHADASPDVRFVSYVPNQSTSPSYREPPDPFLYISAADGKWRRKVQAEVTDAVWIPGQRAIVYTSYDKPGLVVHSVDGRNAPLAKDQGGGSLMLSGNGKSLLWQPGRKLRLLRVPENPSKLLDPKAWETTAEFDLDPDYPVQYGALSNDGTIAVLGGPSKGANNLLAVLNLITGKSLVYSIRGAMIQLGWSRDQRYLIGSLFQPSKGGGSVDLAAIRVDLSSVNHSGPIDWNNPEPASPQILLEMPLQTRSITWSELPSDSGISGVQLGHTGNPGWKPYMRARTRLINQKGHVKYPVAGGKAWWVTTGQPARIRFKTPGLSGTPDGVVSFTVESIDGNGIRHDDSGQQTWSPSCTVIYVMPAPKVSGANTWNRNNTGTLTIRRVNSIAQDEEYLKEHYPSLGYEPTGSKVLGGCWGAADQQLVKLLTPSGSVTWNEGVTANAGKFPGGDEVQFLSHNKFFWEEFILGLRTEP